MTRYRGLLTDSTGTPFSSHRTVGVGIPSTKQLIVTVWFTMTDILVEELVVRLMVGGTENTKNIILSHLVDIVKHYSWVQNMTLIRYTHWTPRNKTTPE